jgi:hypothetical protein
MWPAGRLSTLVNRAPLMKVRTVCPWTPRGPRAVRTHQADNQPAGTHRACRGSRCRGSRPRTIHPIDSGDVASRSWGPDSGERKRLRRRRLNTSPGWVRRGARTHAISQAFVHHASRARQSGGRCLPDRRRAQEWHGRARATAGHGVIAWDGAQKWLKPGPLLGVGLERDVCVRRCPTLPHGLP